MKLSDCSVGAGRGDHSDQVHHACFYFLPSRRAPLSEVQPQLSALHFPLTFSPLPSSQLPPSTPLGTQLSGHYSPAFRELSALSCLHTPTSSPLRLVPLTQAVAQLSAKLIWPNVTLLRNAFGRLAYLPA